MFRKPIYLIFLALMCACTQELPTKPAQYNEYFDIDPNRLPDPNIIPCEAQLKENQYSTSTHLDPDGGYLITESTRADENYLYKFSPSNGFQVFFVRFPENPKNLSGKYSFRVTAENVAQTNALELYFEYNNDFFASYAPTQTEFVYVTFSDTGFVISLCQISFDNAEKPGVPFQATGRFAYVYADA